ncbi:MAG: hypothetical protein PHO70_01495 [Candidatus Omnitrophica bacterium]|nr:hypothetical protein [Candidatus Omnitrophota bacterium]
MNFKRLLFLVSFVFVSLLAGCETSKGVAVGVAGTAVGAVEDTKNTYSFLERVDNWMRKNMW